jgi:hypothetical protein
MRILSIKFCEAKLDYNVQHSHPWLAARGKAFPPLFKSGYASKKNYFLQKIVPKCKFSSY